MFCIICGTENPEYARFCRKCGRPTIEKDGHIDARKCTHADATPLLGIKEQSESTDQSKLDEFAAHYKRLTTDELGSLRAGISDLIPEAKTALENELETRQESDEAKPDQRLPYRWGKFQGWVLLVVGCFAAIALIALVLGVPLDERSKGYAIVSPLMLASGYAFVRRRKYAAVMPYLWMGVYALSFALSVFEGLTNKSLTPEQQGYEIGTGLGSALFGFVAWGLCAIYYHKRRSEFATAAE